MVVYSSGIRLEHDCKRKVLPMSEFHHVASIIIDTKYHPLAAIQLEVFDLHKFLGDLHIF